MIPGKNFTKKCGRNIENPPNLKPKEKNLISASVFITIITITIWFILSTAATIFAPLSAPHNITCSIIGSSQSKKLSAIRDDLASSVSTCPYISLACSAPHNIAIDLLYNTEVVHPDRSLACSASHNIAKK